MKPCDLVLLQLIFVVEGIWSSCYEKQHYGVNFIYCNDIKSLNEIPTEFYNLRKSRLYVRNSTFSLTQKGFFNTTSMFQLEITFSNITTIQSQFFENFSTLRQLIIKDSHIDNLEAFPKDEIINRIDLERNVLPYFPVDVFRNVSTLENVFATDNTVAELQKGRQVINSSFFSLQALPSNLFANTRIINVGLSGNGIVKVESDTFKGLNNLEYLELGRNRIQELPTKVFVDLSSLTFLDLSFNLIRNLDGQVFDGLSKLEKLLLSNNKLTDVKDEWFTNTPSLKALDLGSNNIAHFDVQINSLKCLSLSNNQINDLGKFLFEGLPSLGNLDLSHNNLSEVQPSAFKGLKNLNDLNLEYNQISSLQSSVFAVFSNLSSLTLSKNNITHLHKIEFESLTRLKQLNLSFNDIRNLKPEELQGPISLEELDLTDTHLSNLNKEMFAGLERLKKLNLSFNKLEEIAPGTFDYLRALEVLNLDNTGLTDLKPDTFKGLNLTDVILDNNKLTSLSFTLFNGSPLFLLSLRNTKVQKLEPNTLGHTDNLFWLHLDNTLIESLDIIGTLPALRFIQLAGTKFENVTSTVIQGYILTKINDKVWDVWIF